MLCYICLTGAWQVVWGGVLIDFVYIDRSRKGQGRADILDF